MPVSLDATATVIGEITVEIGGVEHDYLSTSLAATATFSALDLRVVTPLSALPVATATTDVTLSKKLRLSAPAAASASIPALNMPARIDLGNLPPGQDSIVGSRNIRVFVFATATMRKRKRLVGNLAASATFSALLLRTKTNLATGIFVATATATATLSRRYRLAADLAATATFDDESLYTHVRMAVNASATATITAPLYMNIFDVAPVERTVFVRFNPRVVVLPPPRREVDA